MSNQRKRDFGCPKCGNEKAEVTEIATTGTGLSRIFDVQLNQFQVVSCTHCGYSELYKKSRSKGMDVVDFFLGS